MSSYIFDTHSHYDDKAFDSDRDEILGGLLAKGIGKVVDVGADMPSSKMALELAKQYEFVYAALGSELQRKSAAILSIEKDENPEISVVKALKVRDGSPLDIPLMQFRWDKQAGMPVYVGEKPRAEKEKRKERELAEMAREAFARQEKYGYIELCELIQETLDVKERTAKGYIRYMREKEIVEKEGDCYVHGQRKI